MHRTFLFLAFAAGTLATRTPAEPTFTDTSGVPPAAGVAVDARAGSYTVTEIALPALWSREVFVNGLNNRGEVVGTSSILYSDDSEAFLYRGGRLLQFNWPLGLESSVNGINDSGEVVGAGVNTFYPFPLLIHAYHLSNGKVTDLFKYNYSFATGINCGGQIVGSYSTAPSEVYGDQNPAYPYRAFLCARDGKRFVDLGTLPGGGATYATGLNDLGEVVGYAEVKGQNRAFLYGHGRMVDLGVLPGDTASEANAVNNQGQVVGYSYHTVGFQTYGHAFLYAKGKMHDLGTLPGYAVGEAYAINAQGDAVGGCLPSENNTLLVPHAFLYRQGRMQDLNGLIPLNSGWTLHQAGGINNLGQIAGVGGFNGSEAFLLTPTHQ